MNLSEFWVKVDLETINNKQAPTQISSVAFGTVKMVG